MRSINQILAVTWLNLRNLPQRFASSVVAIIGVAAVVLVFAAVLSMSKGFERTMIAAGSDDTATTEIYTSNTSSAASDVYKRQVFHQAVRQYCADRNADSWRCFLHAPARFR